MLQQPDPGTKNQLLAALPQEEYERLLPKLEKVDLEFHQTLLKPDHRIENVYFPLNSVVSLLNLMENGETAEVGIVGYEGIVGLPIFLDADSTTNLAIAQIPGKAMKMTAQDFKEEANRPGKLQSLLKRYTQALIMQVSQSAACNRFHSVEERFCRWILMNHDRAQKDDFVMTQEFASEMLGVRRPTVSIAASMLQKAGLIRYRRGNMTILDRKGLEEGCCECYQSVKKDFDQLLGDRFKTRPEPS